MDVKYFTDEQIKKTLAIGFEGEAMWVPASEQRRSACAPSTYPGTVPARPAAPRLLRSPPCGYRRFRTRPGSGLPQHWGPQGNQSLWLSCHQVAAGKPGSTGPLLDNFEDMEKEAETKRGRFWVRGTVDNAGLCLLRKSLFILAPTCEMIAVLGLEKTTKAERATDGSHGDRKVSQTARRCHGSLSYVPTWTWLRNNHSWLFCFKLIRQK